jgi:AAA+ ATPase superfamily predicted ATPase
MLFDLRPKETREELYDREKELDELKHAIEKPIILITGMRMVGKTSLLKVFLKECTFPNAFVTVLTIDSYKELYTIFSDILTQLNKKSPGKILSNVLKHIDGVNVYGIEIKLSWKEQRANLQDIFEQVNRIGEKVIIAIDEAQRFKGKFEKHITSLLTYCYDNCKNITFILTGSEVGTLYDLLGVESYVSPFFGRHIEYIKLKPFSKNMSIEFLKEGFSQHKMNVNEDLIEYALDRLDGVVGWLTEVGSIAVGRGVLTKELIDEVAEEAMNVIISSLKSLREGYLYIIEAIAKGYKSEGEIKNFF